MKKLTSRFKAMVAGISIAAWSSIVILFFFLMCVVIFPVELICAAPRSEPVEGSDGYVSLMDVSDKAEVFMLQGVWEFYPNELYSFDDFTYGRTASPRLVEFPHFWSAEPDGIIGNVAYATYRMRVRVPSSFDGMGIYARTQNSAYEVYINDAKICGAGVVDANFSKYVPEFLPTNGYTYSSLAIGAQGRTFSVILHVQNADASSGGFGNNIYIGSAPAVKNLRTVLLMVNGLVSGGLMLLFMCFVAIFLSGRERREYLDYTIVSLLALFLSLTLGGESLMHSTGLNSVFIKKLEYCAVVIGTFFANYGQLRDMIKSKALFRLIQIYTVAATAFFLFSPLMLSSQLRLPLMLLTTTLFVPPLFISARNVFVKRERAALISLSSYVIVFLGILCFIFGSLPWDSVDVLSISLMLHCVLQMIMFLLRYRSVETELKDMTETLEERIKLRTFELTLMKEKAEAATVAKSNFLATMSHEIRTPMNAVMGISDIMRTDNLDDKQREYLADIKKSSKALLQIINDILDFSKIEAGKLEVSPTHFSLHAMYDNICSICRFSADAKGLIFRYSFDDDVPPYIFGDETRIRQIVINIINNAIKYTKEGYIDFYVAKTERNGEECLAFRVKDTGIGIKAEDCSKLFGTFEQLDSFANRKIEGTGLGLTISKQLAELMNGNIELETEYGKGSTFTLIIPLVVGESELADTAAEPYAPVFVTDARVLVVDDIPINLTVAAGFLALHGVHPDTAGGGAEAVEKVRHNAYDMIFMDHMMPEMDGTEAVRIIRSLPNGMYVPVIALTANAVTGARDTLKKAGMNDFLSKPIDAAHLNMILAKWMPQEKIEYGGSSYKNEERSGEYDALFNALSSIEGFSVDAGIAHVADSEDAYVLILRRFCDEIDKYITEITINLEGENWGGYTINLHAVKGVLATVGAGELSKWAYELETASRSKEYAVCKSETRGLLKRVAELRDQLIGAGLTEMDKVSEAKAPMSRDELAVMLNGLDSACMLGDIDAAEEIISKLGKRSFGDETDAKMEEIYELVKSFDFEIVSDKIRNILLRG